MGIDYGHKNVGIAFSDESGSMAFPHGVIKNDSKLLETITSLIIERNVQEVVIGHSVGYTGQANKIHTAVEEFIADLTLAEGIPIHLEPEQYSTQQAIRIQGRNAQTDAAAAAIILDSFITRKK
ncbi:MAG: RuvX/YqgF family protein [Patescibacteria group bacterium]